MRDWTKAEWIDPTHPWTDPLPVSEYPERLLVDFATRCNLRCPMCPVWGSDDERAIDEVKGIMGLEEARRMLDEVAAARPMVAPSVYGEPLLIPNVKEVFTEIKHRGMPIAMNTNGLTLTDELSRFFVELQVDSIMFSLDSVTKETLQKVRGVDKLEKIESNVFRLMRVRGDSEYPRVGVSFTIQPENKHETGQGDKVQYCKPCNGWVQDDYEEEVREGILIRPSPQFTYYYKIDRLKNWKGSLLGGHKPPPAHLVDASAP